MLQISLLVKIELLQQYAEVIPGFTSFNPSLMNSRWYITFAASLNLAKPSQARINHVITLQRGSVCSLIIIMDLKAVVERLRGQCIYIYTAGLKVSQQITENKNTPQPMIYSICSPQKHASSAGAFPGTPGFSFSTDWGTEGEVVAAVEGDGEGVLKEVPAAFIC